MPSSLSRFRATRAGVLALFCAGVLRVLTRCSAALRLPTLGYTLVFPFGHALSRGCSLPVDFATLHPSGCLCSLPRNRPVAWFPASARWHVFRFFRILSRLRSVFPSGFRGFAQKLPPSPFSVSGFKCPVSAFNPARAAALAAALLAADALLLNQASAATYTWDGSSSANPVATANWVGGVLPTWAADDDLFFRTVNTGNFTMTLMADRTVRSLTFGTNSTNDFKVSLNNTNGNTAYNLTMGNATNAATITLNATGGNVTIGSGIGSTFGNIILGNTLTVNQNSTSGLLTIDRSISGGTYGVTKNGAGALTLSGAANSWNGTTNVSVGTTNLSGNLTTGGLIYVGGSSGAVLNITGNLTSTKAADVRNFQITNTASHTGTVNVSGSGILNTTGMFLGDNGGGNVSDSLVS